MANRHIIRKDTSIIGGLLVNAEFELADVIINKNTSGEAYRYDSATDVHTFGSFPVSPSGYPVDDFQFANKKYVDDKMNVSAYYIIASQQTLGVGPATSLLDFATKIHDSHNAVTTGASWKFTAPISGRYLIGGLIATDDAVWRVDDTVSFGIRIDNTTDYTLGSLKGGGTQYGLIPTGSIVMNLLQNQYVQIWGQEWRSGATYTSNGRVQIDRIGGYIS